MARLLFFGPLRDVGEALTPPQSVTTLGALRDWILQEAPELGAALKSAKVRIAIDGEIVHGDDASLAGAREVAFLPPMSGG